MSKQVYVIGFTVVCQNNLHQSTQFDFHYMHTCTVELPTGTMLHSIRTRRAYDTVLCVCPSWEERRRKCDKRNIDDGTAE